MKCGLFTLVNWIIKPQEIAEGSEKTSARFKRGNYNKISFIKKLQYYNKKIPTKEY